MRHTALAILVLAMVPAVARAQDSNDRWAEIQRLTEGKNVKVAVGKDALISGTFLKASGDSLVVRRKGAEVMLGRTEIRTIKVLDTAKRNRNMIIYGAIGAVVGAAPGAMLDSLFYNETGSGAGAAVGFGAVGFTVGVLATRHSGYTTVYSGQPKTTLLRSINIAPVVSKNQKGAALSLSF